MVASGLTIKGTLRSSRFNVVKIDSSCALESKKECPSCTASLDVLTTLCGRGVTLRVGICNTCGYRGHIDRPTKEWMVEFYNSNWDREFSKSPEIMRKDVNLPSEGLKAGRLHAVSLVERISPKGARPFLDIGSGYGQIMKNVEKLGFHPIVGVENSALRAKLVNEVFGFTVIEGDFGSKEVEDMLHKYAPFGVILSNQVLEHMYYPEEVLASISRLQKEGDKLVLAVPNADGEHINHTVFYLLHLHVFTKESLESLLNRFGYEVIEDASPNPANIILAAEKKSGLLTKKFAYREGYMYRANKRLIQGLGFEGMSEGGNYCIVWKQELDGSDAVKVRCLRAFESMLWPLSQVMWFIRSRVLKRISGYITMLVTPRHEQDRESVQIYFEDAVEVLIK